MYAYKAVSRKTNFQQQSSCVNTRHTARRVESAGSAVLSSGVYPILSWLGKGVPHPVLAGGTPQPGTGVPPRKDMEPVEVLWYREGYPPSWVWTDRQL